MVTWVVQENMLASGTRDSLKRACHLAQVEYFPINLIPFSNEMPEVPEGKKFYWGTTTLAKLIYPNDGLFYSPALFSMEEYLNHWGENMLNSDAKVIELRDLCKLKGLPGPWFVRPNADDKSFCGEVLTWEDIQAWLKEPSRFDNDGLTLDTKIMIGKPLNVYDEVRCYIVNGKLITASYYRKNGRSCWSRVECFREGGCLFCCLRHFVRERCKEYMPARNFVMDIALYPMPKEEWEKKKFIPGVGYLEQEMYIIEAGCINCCGFYDCDLPKLVKEISNSL